MSKLQEIKAAQLQARKERNTVKSSLLTTLIGEAEMVGKNAGNRPSTDAEVLQVLKKFEKNLNENIRIYGDRRMADEVDAAWAEMEIIQSFMPAKLTDEKVKDDIVVVMIDNDLKYEQKSMGAITKELKEMYGDQFDGSQVSRLFGELLK